MSFILDTFLFSVNSFHLEHEEEYIRSKTDRCQNSAFSERGRGRGGGGWGEGNCLNPGNILWITNKFTKLTPPLMINQPLDQPVTPPISTQSTNHTTISTRLTNHTTNEHLINQPPNQSTTPPSSTQSTSHTTNKHPINQPHHQHPHHQWTSNQPAARSTCPATK